MINLKESLLGGEDKIYTDLGDLLYVKKMMETVVAGTDHWKLFRVCDELLNYFMDKHESKQIFRRIPADKLKDGIYIIKTPPRLYKSPNMNDMEIAYLKGDECQHISINSMPLKKYSAERKETYVGWQRYAGTYGRFTFSTLMSPKTTRLIYYCGQSEAMDSIWDEMFKKACKYTGAIAVI